jgi:hypothetical protein
LRWKSSRSSNWQRGSGIAPERTNLNGPDFRRGIGPRHHDEARMSPVTFTEYAGVSL